MKQPSELQTERASYIRTILARHDHTQQDLARLLGVTQPTANRKLKGLRKFTDDELLTIADAYGIDPANMLRPPDLTPVLGAVRIDAGGLLTWPKCQAPQVSGPVRAIAA